MDLQVPGSILVPGDRLLPGYPCSPGYPVTTNFPVTRLELIAQSPGYLLFPFYPVRVKYPVRIKYPVRVKYPVTQSGPIFKHFMSSKTRDPCHPATAITWLRSRFGFQPRGNFGPWVGLPQIFPVKCFSRLDFRFTRLSVSPG